MLITFGHGSLNAGVLKVELVHRAVYFTFQDCPQVRYQMHGYRIHAVKRANGIGNNGRGKGRVYREVIIASHEINRPVSGRKNKE